MTGLEVGCRHCLINKDLLCSFRGGHFLAPMRKPAYKSYQVMFFENVKMQKVFCDGCV